MFICKIVRPIQLVIVLESDWMRAFPRMPLIARESNLIIQLTD